jgi:hypothetical protein
VAERGNPSARARIGGVGVGEHVFGRVGGGSDGRGRVQAVLHGTPRERRGRCGHPQVGHEAAAGERVG